jgi:hypothetical protein
VTLPIQRPFQTASGGFFSAPTDFFVIIREDAWIPLSYTELIDDPKLLELTEA